MSAQSLQVLLPKNPTDQTSITRRQLLLGGVELARAKPADARFAFLPHLDEAGYTPTRNFFRRQKHQPVKIEGDTWRLRLDGVLENPASLGLDDLQRLPPVEIACTMACSAHHPQNTLIAHADWRGARLVDLMQRAGVGPEARYVHVISGDGYQVCLEIASLDDAALVYAMSGETLPLEHGYPVRLIVPGMYGSAMPKWITQMVFAESLAANVSEVVGEVGVMAAIFAPRHREVVNGTITIGGVAYAGKREIVGIEVSIDDAPWMPVRFHAVARYMWTPWQIAWTPPASGDYLIRARAVDSAGNVTAEDQLPRVVVRVEG